MELHGKPFVPFGCTALNLSQDPNGFDVSKGEFLFHADDMRGHSKGGKSMSGGVEILVSFFMLDKNGNELDLAEGGSVLDATDPLINKAQRIVAVPELTNAMRAALTTNILHCRGLCENQCDALGDAAVKAAIDKIVVW